MSDHSTHAEQKLFSFGTNWQKFLKAYDAERLDYAACSLSDFLGERELTGKSFLDIGCGSGLFSYAAYSLGAAPIMSFDIDPYSVACCRQLRALAQDPPYWTVQQGSILDKQFLRGLGEYDIVYSWGVLHHTGRMWEAMQNAMSLVAPGGYFYIAIYNKILGRDGGVSWIHRFWLTIKKMYNDHPMIGRYVFEPMAMSAYVVMLLLMRRNPYTYIRDYKSHRGMSWRTDATDWLGGYPYEFATVDEVFSFVRSSDRAFQLVNINTTCGRGLNWYLFKKTASEP
ncbi:MAG: class I SAM-dependent methyltransferase [Desulfomonilaceae bacterium]